MWAYLQIFEATATAGEWPPAQWCIYLRNALSGQGLVAVASMAASEQIDYEVVKTTLLRTYHISSETYRKRIFETHLTPATLKLGSEASNRISNNGLRLPTGIH